MSVLPDEIKSDVRKILSRNVPPIKDLIEVIDYDKDVYSDSDSEEIHKLGIEMKQLMNTFT